MASGVINGTCTGTSARKYNIWVEWSSIPEPQNGRSLLIATEYLQRNDGWEASAYNLNALAINKKININGSIYNNPVKGIDTRNKAKVTVVTHSNYVYHDSNGNANAVIEAVIPVVVSPELTGGRVYGVISLDNIDTKKLNFTDFKVSIIDQASVKFEWNLDGVADKIWYSVNGGMSWVDMPENGIVTGLIPNATYQFAVRARKSTNQLLTDSSIIPLQMLPIYITKIDVENFSVDVGSRVKVEYSVEPNNASIPELTLISSDESILKVDGQYVTALSAGNVQLKLTSKDGSNVEKVVTVNTVQRVTGIIVSPNSVTLGKGTSYTIQYQILPENATNKNVVLTSLDEQFATVSGNVITAVEVGNVQIEVKTVDGGFDAILNLAISGEYTWYDMPKALEILNTEDISHILSNIKTIRAMLISKGYNIEDLIIVDNKKSIPLIDMFDFLKNIEYNIGIINSTDIKSIYYIEPKTVGEYALNKEDIWRWLQILNDLYLILNGTFGKWGRLLCTDGYPTINGFSILLRGDKIG